MLSGFSPIHSSYKNLFKRDTYGDKWHHPLLGFPLLLGMMLFWDLIVVPYRKLRG
jgi:hypothetical protein